MRDYPLSPYADDAKKRLTALEKPIPDPDPVALARQKYELENLDKPGMMSHFWGMFRKSPDVSMAAKSGQPAMESMRPTVPVTVPGHGACRHRSGRDRHHDHRPLGARYAARRALSQQQPRTAPRPTSSTQRRPSRALNSSPQRKTREGQEKEEMSRILLADDSPHAQRMGERILREEGFEVVTVTDGETALMRMPDVDPDLVLVDILLPQKSGYEICEFVKTSPQHRHTRVVLLAGLLEPVDEAEAARVKADGVLKKPLEASVVIATVKPLVAAARRIARRVTTTQNARCPMLRRPGPAQDRQHPGPEPASRDASAGSRNPAADESRRPCRTSAEQRSRKAGSAARATAPPSIPN